MVTPIETPFKFLWSEHATDGGTERRILTSVADMRATLETDFCLTLPDVPELDAALARLTAHAS